MMNFDEPLSKVQFLKMFGKRVRPGDSQTETGERVGIYRLGLAALPNGSSEWTCRALRTTRNLVKVPIIARLHGKLGTVFAAPRTPCWSVRNFEQRDQWTPIVVESATPTKSVNFPVNSRAGIFGGLATGIQPPAKSVCAFKTTR